MSKQLDELLKEYPGLKADDLDIDGGIEGNISYSCVICSNGECPRVGYKKGACPEYIPTPLKDFILRYDFEKGAPIYLGHPLLTNCRKICHDGLVRKEV
jgi:hypothetical protein